MSGLHPKTQFRPAQSSDAPRILKMLRQFYSKAGGLMGIPFDDDSTVETIIKTMERGACLVGDHSCAGAIFGEFPYNHNARIAHVVFWYFTKPREIRIFEALTKVCQEKGCTHINPSSLWPSNTVGRYYRKLGLRESETQWLGEIACILPRKD